MIKIGGALNKLTAKVLAIIRKLYWWCHKIHRLVNQEATVQKAKLVFSLDLVTKISLFCKNIIKFCDKSDLNFADLPFKVVSSGTSRLLIAPKEVQVWPLAVVCLWWALFQNSDLWIFIIGEKDEIARSQIQQCDCFQCASTKCSPLGIWGCYNRTI